MLEDRCLRRAALRGQASQLHRRSAAGKTHCPRTRRTHGQSDGGTQDDTIDGWFQNKESWLTLTWEFSGLHHSRAAGAEIKNESNRRDDADGSLFLQG